MTEHIAERILRASSSNNISSALISALTNQVISDQVARALVEMMIHAEGQEAGRLLAEILRKHRLRPGRKRPRGGSAHARNLAVATAWARHWRPEIGRDAAIERAAHQFNLVPDAVRMALDGRRGKAIARLVKESSQKLLLEGVASKT